MPKLTMAVEIKNKEVSGPMLAQIVGNAISLVGRNFSMLFVICRGVNRGAKSMAAKNKKNLGITTVFKEVKQS